MGKHGSVWTRASYLTTDAEQRRWSGKGWSVRLVGWKLELDASLNANVFASYYFLVSFRWHCSVAWVLL